MVSSVSEVLRQLDFSQIHRIFLDYEYYTLLFPFLLIFAVMYTVLTYVQIFQKKETGEPIKPVVFIVALVVSSISVWFEISSGYRAGDLLIMMFPNISALTIGILTLYIVGSLFGQDFFRGMFKKDVSTHVYFVVGVIGLGAIVFYLGIVFGMWDFDPLDTRSYWNVVIAVVLFVFGAFFMMVGLWGWGSLLIFIVGVYVWNYGEQSVLDFIFDPIIFILVLIVLLISWLTSGKDAHRGDLRTDLINAEKAIEEYKKLRGGNVPKLYESRVYDVLDQKYQDKKKKWKELYGDEDW